MQKGIGNWKTIKLIYIILFAVFYISPSLHGSTLDSAEISNLYAQARKIFQEANELAATDTEQARSLYTKSLMRYERIVKEGDIHNGKLYYNMGNIYFRTKDIGRAILNYRKAEQYIPNDTNLRQNLDFARATRNDQIEEKQKTKILKTLFFWHYDLSTKNRMILFALSFALLWIFASMRIFIRKSFIKWCIGAALTFSLFFAGSLFIEHVHLQKTIPGVVISPEVIARKGNSETYERSFKEPLHAGTEFNLIENRGNWLHIELPDSRTCWVPTVDIELVR